MLVCYHYYILVNVRLFSFGVARGYKVSPKNDIFYQLQLLVFYNVQTIY
jgi:hypothetical protein